MTKQTVLLLISIVSVHVLGAQTVTGPRVGLTTIAPVQYDVSGPLLAPDRHVSSNNWARGAIIGGLIGTAIGVLFYNAFEHETHGTIYIVVWAFGGAVVGGLIGAGSHKT